MSAVTGYRVERCTGSSCTNFAQIATSTVTSYSDTGRTANTTYRYRVRAADAANNLSAYSSIRNVTTTTADTAAPNVSINSTSQNALDAGVDPYTVGPVTEGPKPKNANSLSPPPAPALPAIRSSPSTTSACTAAISTPASPASCRPFQVLLAQVIQKGAEPTILGPTQASVSYTAASNAGDPILSKPLDPVTGYPFTGLTSGNQDVFKTNFWSLLTRPTTPSTPRRAGRLL